MKKLLIILFLALLTINVSCGGGGSGGSAGTSLVTITVGEGMQSVSLKIEKNTLLAQAGLFLKKLMPDAAFAAIPSNVYKITFTISASDMATMTKDVLVQGQTSITETFSVPNGNDRYFLVEAKDISDKVLYHGEATNVDLDGIPVNLSIQMESVVVDTTPPTVISTSPANNETGVAVTSAITITFSESIDPSTFNADTFSLRNNGSNVEGEISFNGAVIIFTPSANLAYSTTYTAKITTGIKDLAGNAMAENYTWAFVTGAAPDITPPTVTGVSPGSGATDVSITTTVTATFSEAMDDSTINTTTFTLVNGGSPVSGTVTYTDTTATFTPSGNLNYSTTYTATITTEVKDLAGNAMAANYTWSFTTIEPGTTSKKYFAYVKDNYGTPEEGPFMLDIVEGANGQISVTITSPEGDTGDLFLIYGNGTKSGNNINFAASVIMCSDTNPAGTGTADFTGTIDSNGNITGTFTNTLSQNDTCRENNSNIYQGTWRAEDVTSASPANIAGSYDGYVTTDEYQEEGPVPLQITQSGSSINVSITITTDTGETETRSGQGTVYGNYMLFSIPIILCHDTCINGYCPPAEYATFFGEFDSGTNTATGIYGDGVPAGDYCKAPDYDQTHRTVSAKGTWRAVKK